MYKLLLKILFLFDAERMHYFSMNSFRFLCNLGLRGLFRKLFEPSALPVTVFGLQFKNPVGLGAGFDKNAKYLSELSTTGFAFIEIGTVTPRPQKGNDKPRLFRLPHDKALINRMGFNNDGVDVIGKRLAVWNEKCKLKNFSRIIIGGNIGKNKDTSNEDAWKDYEICFKGLFDHVDYFVVNVSSPNTPGLRELQEKDSLRKILANLQSINKQHAIPKALLIKISPDLTNSQLDDVIHLVEELDLTGIVATNTTLSRQGLSNGKQVADAGAGGLSGAPLRQRSTEVIRYIREKSSKKFTIIGSGGIFTGADAEEKIEAGADLVQVWTGFIYEGGSTVKRITRYLHRKS